MSKGPLRMAALAPFWAAQLAKKGRKGAKKGRKGAISAYLSAHADKYAMLVSQKRIIIAFRRSPAAKRGWPIKKPQPLGRDWGITRVVG